MDLRVMPWSNLEEFRSVKEHLLSEDHEHRQTGLDFICVWRSKTPSLPSGVETSAYLVAALDMEPSCRSELARSTLATALVRFVNLVSHLGQNSPYHQSIVDVAIAMNVPEWLVGLRHDVTHGQMPSLEALTVGARDAMKWLKEYYWDVEETRLRDWVFVKQVSSKRKKKKNSPLSWRQLKGFRTLHEGLDLHFFLMDLSSAKIHSLNQLSDPSLMETILKSISKQGLDYNDFKNVLSAARGVLDKVLTELETMCEMNQIEEIGDVLAQLLSEGDYFTTPPVTSAERYRYILRKLCDFDGIATFMTELRTVVLEDSTKSGEAADWFVEIGKSLIGRGQYKLWLKKGFDWLSLGRELMESPNQYTKQCLEVLFDLKKIPSTNSHRQAAFKLLELRLNGPDNVELEDFPVLNGEPHLRKRTLSETSTSSEMSEDLNFRNFLQKKEGNHPQDTASYPIGWNSDYRSLFLTDHTWKSA